MRRCWGWELAALGWVGALDEEEEEEEEDEEEDEEEEEEEEEELEAPAPLLVLVAGPLRVVAGAAADGGPTL
jgi:hypothetical protein